MKTITIRLEDDVFNKIELQHTEAIRKIQEERIKDLQNQVGFLQLEYQKVNDRLLLPSPEKKWWQIWKN